MKCLFFLDNLIRKKLSQKEIIKWVKMFLHLKLGNGNH